MMNLDEMEAVIAEAHDAIHQEIESNKALDSQRSVDTEHLRLIGMVF